MSRLRRAVFLVAFASASVSAQSKGVIEGTIVDQSGRGIAGAQATLAPPGRHGVSDDDGIIQFADIGPGIYTLSVRRIGFEPASVRVVLRAAPSDTVARTTVTLVAIPRLLDSVRISEKASGLRYAAVVLDQYDRPVAGAEVIAMGITSDVVTDSAGHFSIGKLGKGALIVRARKIGYSPALQSMRMLADRTDTLRMTRLATSLTPVQIREASGYGMDFWAYRELQSRMAWKSPMAGAISREELDARGKQDLCDALPGTPSGNKYSLHNDPKCKSFPDGIKNILVDGAMCRKGLLSDYNADDVEMVEFVPTDISGSLGARRCGPPAFVIWMRKPPVVESGPPDVALPRTITGTVYDSVTSRPLAGAHVHLADLSRDTVADSLGVFRFDNVGAGVHSLWADHPAIDRLGLFEVAASVDATPNLVNNRDLAIPSFGTLWKRACGASRPAEPTEGFVYGRVLLGGAATPAAREPVRVTWFSTADTGAPKLVGRKSMAGVDGAYAICGVPLGLAVSIEAGQGDTVTTPVAFRLGELRVARRDITMPTNETLVRLRADSSVAAPLSADDGATLAGTLSDSAGRPVPSARITISGVTGQWGVTPGGAFTVRGVPAGSHVVSITAVGFVEERRFVEVAPADSVPMDVPMTRLGTTLSTVTVSAERARMAARVEEIDRRHRAGFGFWVDSARLAKAFSIQQTLTFPRVEVVNKSARWFIRMYSGVLTIPQAGKGGGSNFCDPTIWLDGQLTDIDAMQDVTKDEIGLIEVYPTAARAPAQYGGTRTNCGVVLFWSKRYIKP